jgi:hypothetical protein
MGIFRKDAAGMLEKARADLGKVEAAIAEFERKRHAALVEADDVKDIAAIDAAIVANGRAVQILRDRIEALTVEVCRQEAERREQQRAAALQNIAKRLESRAATAVRLMAAVRQVGELAATLTADGGVKEAWPFASPRFVHWQADNIGHGILALLLQQAPALFDTELVKLINRRVGLDDIAGRIDSHNTMLFAALRDMPIDPAGADDDEEAVAA